MKESSGRLAKNDNNIPKNSYPTKRSFKKSFVWWLWLTIEQAAEMLDMPLTTLSNFLKGKTKMSLDFARRLDLAGVRNFG